MNHNGFRPVIYRVANGILIAISALTAVGNAQDPMPTINQPLVPDAIAPGSPAFTLTVNGTGFVSGSVVKWNGSPLTTTFASGSRLTASVPASDVSKASTASITVVNPTPGGGTSNMVCFETTISSTSIGLSVPALFDVPGNSHGGITVGDFNHDGKLDLAEANGVSGTDDQVSVLLGKGDGTFQPAVNYSLGGDPQSVTVGDFNHDGNLDLVVGHSYSNVVSVLLGNGDGTFQPAVNYSVATYADFVAVGDFNRDGNLDLVVAQSNGASNDVSILLGNGDGTFQAAVTYAVDSVPDSVAVGDFNHDGNLDLVVVNSNSNDVSILLGNGDGTFQPPVNYSVGTYADSVAVGDFNGDGNLDLVVANGGSNDVSILLGNGDGTFQSAVNYAGGGGPLSVTVGDLNGDGKLDLAISNDGNVSALLGNGDGTFQPAVEWPAAGSNSLVLGDFNGDGRLDVALSDGSDAAVSVLVQIAAISLSKTSLTFVNQVVGTTSAAQAVVLTNSSGFTLNISSIALTGTNPNDFGQTNTCGSGVPAGGSCTISANFNLPRSGRGPRRSPLPIMAEAARKRSP